LPEPDAVSDPGVEAEQGRDCQACISSITLSVIRLTVSFETNVL